MGTFGYMPLERYEGRASPASDIYALAGTLVLLLTHRAPHELPRRGLAIDFRRHANVSGAFADVIERRLEPDPAERYASVEELLRDRGAGVEGRVLLNTDLNLIATVNNVLSA